MLRSICLIVCVSCLQPGATDRNSGAITTPVETINGDYKGEKNDPDSRWKLVFEENFDKEYDVDQKWTFQHGPSTHIKSSRWRENATVRDGLLVLNNKVEDRGGQHFTSASLRTKEKFRYGYFECRYVYGEATGLNNSFWLMNGSPDEVIFEIDINEGHYPNRVSSNVHKHRPLPRLSNGKSSLWGPANRPDVEIVLNKPVRSNKIRIMAKDFTHVNISEIKVFPVMMSGYLPVFDKKADAENIARKGKASASCLLKPEYPADHVNDGDLRSRWVSSDEMPAWIVLDLDKPYEIGAIQLLTGYKQGDQYKAPLNNFDIQYWNGAQWIDIDFPRTEVKRLDLSKDYLIYALEWNEKELIWYIDGKEVRREPNSFCHSASPVILSSAVVKSAGSTAHVDGTSMKVDYVRVYKSKK